MERLDRVYYMRAIIGIIAGIIAGIVIAPGTDQAASVGTALLIAIVFYIASVGIGRGMARAVPKDKQRKVATDGIFPFIFMLITFMIIVYTALNQSTLG